MKIYLLIIFIFITAIGKTQNVGIGTLIPAERLHVTFTDNSNKNVIYGYANQTANFDYQNTGVAGFGEGNGVSGSGGWGYGFGMKGIGSTNSYGAVGVYAGLGTSIPIPSIGNNYYALLADAGASAANRYAGIFMGGNVGIGTFNPTQTLDVTGRMHLSDGVIQRGGLPITATSDLGLYSRISGNYIRFVTNAAPIRFYSDDNIGSNANMTIEANGNVGIGTTTPVNKLDVAGAVNITGPLKISGNTGASGQVLQSNGVAAPAWVSPTNSLYSNMVHLDQSSGVNLTTGAYVDLPGLTYTFSLSSNARVITSFYIHYYAASCFGCGNSTGRVYINVDGGRPYFFDHTINNAAFDGNAASTILNLGTGSHTIKLEIYKTTGPDLTAGLLNSFMDLVIVKQ